MSILQFHVDGNDWLSNMYPAEFVWDNIIWPTSEHAYQAAKVLDRQERIELSKIKNPKYVKKLGKQLKTRGDWKEVRVLMMKNIVRQKFQQNPELKEKLLATGDQHIEEGNNWGDTFWGVCPVGSDQGFNNLGEILMEIREELKC